MSAPRTVVTGTIVLDLRPVDPNDRFDSSARRKILTLTVAPFGASVVLVVLSRQYVDPSIGHMIRSEAFHLGSVTVECDDPGTIARWVSMLRAGDMAVAG